MQSLFNQRIIIQQKGSFTPINRSVFPSTTKGILEGSKRNHSQAEKNKSPKRENTHNN